MNNNYETDNDYYQRKNEKRNVELKGCLPYAIFCIVLVVIFMVIVGCNGEFERKDPRAVTYREKVSDIDTSEVWRNVTYEFVSVSYDTVPKVRRGRSTIEPEILAPKVQTVPKDLVDLNDYLGSPDDETDWNYTEIDDEGAKYLDSIGVYWDSNKEYWRKRK